PPEDHVVLPEGTAPAITSEEVFQAVQEQLAVNKQDALRNNKAQKEEIGLLRAGYVRCGICNYTMVVHRKASRRSPEYCCQRKTGQEDLLHHHFTSIVMHTLDAAALEKIIEVVQN